MKNKLKNLTPWIFLFALVLLVFRAWFGFGEISSGDAAFYFDPTLKDLNFFPSVWTNSGVGRFNSLQNAFPYLFFSIKILSSLNLTWIIIERISWYWPFILLSFFSSWYLTRTIFPKNVFLFLSPLVFLFNTYILMIVGGGQITIAFAYALSPLLLAVFLKNINQYKTKLLFLSGLLLAIQVSFEPRIAALIMSIAFFYSLLKYQYKLFSYLKIFLVPLLITVGMHFYWLFPSIILQRSTYAQSLSSSDWVSFLSFAQFSNAFSLLHPNWPENIFGKTYFMRPEFLGIPILVYSSLLFLSSKFKVQSSKSQLKVKSDNNETILFFALLGLLGAFLAKGSNPPFGEVYLWLFNYVPGMNLFRDSTKFYLWVVLSYSILIPLSVSNIYSWLSLKFKVKSSKLQLKVKSYLPNLFLLLVTCYLLLVIQPAWLGQLGGTFKSRVVPQEYAELKDFLVSQPEFFRTFWVPQKQRFGFYSNTHPAIDGQELFKVTSASAIAEKFSEENMQKILAQAAVKYIIIPYDSEGEIFLKDRRYDPEQRLGLEKELDETVWLKKISPCCSNDLNHDIKIAVYEMPNFKDHFWVKEGAVDLVKYRMINPTKYEVEITNATQSFTLVFSETFDEFWQARVDDETITSEKIYEDLNSFTINKKGDFNIIVEFAAQKYVWWGGAISLLTIITSIFLLLRKS